ncbi:E7 [Gammapapillomavirus 15]|uniref:Protein E7 n=2 Tax=Papillomaviridae TaxID=151340 RepID=A0A385PKL5_9PAPI|nr:E7 [Gammapapillomavirus 15]AYA94481.1 MAG: E7 protein [Human papillomavirus]
MRGLEPIPEGIELDLHDLVLPANLIATEESLSPDTESEEEQRYPYKVDTYCDSCRTGVRIFIVATASSVRTLQQLLVEELSLLCIGCSRTLFQHGRS